MGLPLVLTRWAHKGPQLTNLRRAFRAYDCCAEGRTLLALLKGAEKAIEAELEGADGVLFDYVHGAPWLLYSPRHDRGTLGYGSGTQQAALRALAACRAYGCAVSERLTEEALLARATSVLGLYANTD